jgi:16S rRNA G527 N7-methylase RsmG
MLQARLGAWTKSVGVVVSGDGWERLERLVGLWQQYGDAMNLVGSTSGEALAEHVQEGLQCVACAEAVRPLDEDCCWVDVGSGGGLPGLVVAAVRPCRMLLLEPRRRRAAFLDLGLVGVGMGRGRVIRARWSRSTWNDKLVSTVESQRETKFYILSSRAVFPPATWLRESEVAEVAEGVRGMTLCHMDSSATEVDGQKPHVMVRGPRWTVMGFLTECST